MARSNDASEFGGVPGLVQPIPHEPTPQEQAMIMRMQPDDPLNPATVANPAPDGVVGHEVIGQQP